MPKIKKMQTRRKRYQPIKKVLRYLDYESKIYSEFKERDRELQKEFISQVRKRGYVRMI